MSYDKKSFFNFPKVLKHINIEQICNAYGKLPCLIKEAVQAFIVVVGTTFCTFLEIIIIHSALIVLINTNYIESPTISYLLSQSNNLISSLSIILWAFTIIAYKLNSTYKQIIYETSTKEETQRTRIKTNIRK
jgi:predicted neutral ceramidase superfamily lipid hydrolase